MSAVSGKAKGRASAGPAALLGGGEPVIGRRPRGAQGIDSSSRSSTPVSVASAAGTGSRGASHTTLAAATTTEKMGLTAARKKRRRFAAVDDVVYDEDEDLAMDVDFHDSEDSRGVNSEADEEDDLDGSLDEEAASVWSEASDETSVSDAGKQKLLPRRPKSPEFIDDEDIPPLELPDTSTDLFIEGQDLMQALGVYEVMRHFSANLRMSPFRFEEFCAALCTDEQSSLLVEMHVMLIRALLREDDGNNTMFGPQDVKDSINILLYVLDPMTWYEIIRTYLESDPSAEFSQALPALEKPTYSSLTVSERLQILVSLTNLFLSTNPVREEITNEGNINYDDHCRSCHRLGDLLCCDTCPAVYHLTCLDLPEVPEDDWICSVCKLHQVKGVTDCTSEAEKSGLLCRHEPIGYDRHRRKYWFLCRRIIIEDEEDVRYLSIPLQLEELIECLDGDRYEKDLVSCLKEMKDEIVRQMTMTEDLTKENQGSRKSALEIANANLLKLRSERDSQPEEEPKKQTEDNATKSGCEDVEDSAETEGKELPSSDDIHMAVDDTKEELSQPSAATSDCDTMSSESVASKTDSVAIKAELNSDAPEAKEDVDSAVAASAHDSVASNSLKQEPEDVKSNDIKQETEALKPETKDVDIRSKTATPSACKTIMVIGRDGGKMLMSLVRPNANGSERSVVMGSVSSTQQESLNQVSNEGRRIVTRSKTGSLTPKQFSDSITIATTAAKTSVKMAVDESSAVKDGDGLRRIRSKATLPVSAFLLSQSTYFKLGAEGSFRLYENQYSTNPLALNKNQHNEERERKRHLSHKFSLTPVSEFSWSGLTLGLSGVLLGTLRQNILQLESNIPAPFLHPNWPQHRARWTKLANAALRPEEFANVLAMLESSLKPVVFNQVWHEALGHSKLCRTPVLDREEIKKRDRKEQKKRKDEEGEELAKNTWVKYSLGLRHQVWKQKGEEYRVMGQGGWIWISTTRISRYAPASATGLRLLAAKLQTRKRKALEKEAAKETKGQEENSDGKKENGGTGGCFLNETNGLMIMEDDDTTAKAKEVDEDVEVEDTDGSMQLEVENFDISRALLSRSHYSRITKPYSRLEHLLDRRLKLAEHEQKQKTIFEHIVKQYHSQKMGQKDEPITGARSSESADGGGVASAFPCHKTAEEASRETTSDGTVASGVSRGGCYSTVCRSKDVRNAQSLNNCYSSLCRYFGARMTSNLVSELPGLGLANGNTGHAESEEEEGSNNDEVCLDHEDKEDGLPFEQSNDCGDNTPVYEDLMRIRNQIAEAQGVENTESTNGSNKVLCSGATKQTPRKETISSQNIGAGFSDGGAVLSLMSFFHDGKLHITAEVIKQLEARLSRMDRTELPVVLTKRGPGRPSKAAPNARSFGLLKKGAIPSIHRYLTPSKKSSLFVLRRHFLRSLARREGKCETPGFNYACKMSNVNWPYPCPRPYFKTAWEYRTMMMCNIPAVATQLRVLWACIRWDDLSTKVPPSGTNTVTTETDITTTKLLKRRDVGPFGLRSEFLVRKIVIPISVPSQPREKYTPQRSGLRERRRPESPKLKEPSVTECWVAEEQLDLWEIKLFGDRIEKQNRLAVEKSQQQQQRQSGGEGSLDKGPLDEQLKNQRLTTAAAAGVKRMADGQLKTPDSGIGLKSVSSLISSSASNLRVIQVQQPAQRSLLASAASGSLLSTPASAASVSGGDSGQTVQNLRIVHGPNGQLQVQGLLPGQQIIRLPNGQLHLVTATSKTSQPQSKSSTSVLLSSHAAQSKSEMSVSGGTNFSTVSTTGPLAADVASTSATAGSRTPSQVAIIGGQRIVLTGGSIVSQATVGGSALKPGQSLSKFVVVPGGSLALSGQKQPLLVTGGGGAAPKLVKLPLQLQQSQQQQPGKVMLSSGQVISGQPTILRTATGQHFIIHSGAAAQETPASAAALVAQHGATSPDAASAVGAAQSLLASPNSLTSSVNLSTSPSAVSPTKYTVTPQVLQQVVNQALMQTQDPEITAKLLMMQKVMQQQTSGSGAVVSCNQQLQLKQQPPVKASGASVRHQKGLTQELKEEQTRLSDCNQVMRGIFDNVEKCEKQEQKRQRKQETADEKVKRIFLHKLEGQLMKRKESLKKEILRKRNILEKTISSKIQSEITQVVEARHSRRIVHAKKSRPDYAVRMDLGPLTVCAPISAVNSVACELEVKEPKSKRRKQKVVTAGNATRAMSGSAGNSDDKLYCLCKTPYDESKFYIGCDRCEDWFHGSCVGVTKSEADRMDTYVCPSCRATSGDSATTQTRLQDQHQVELRRLLNVIKVHRMSWPFREPVCPKEVPDYYTVIKEPMDLSTIEKKLLSHQYSTLGEFVKDITKIFDNCRYYNPSSSPFYRCAEALEIYFVEKLKALKEKLKL